MSKNKKTRWWYEDDVGNNNNNDGDDDDDDDDGDTGVPSLSQDMIGAGSPVAAHCNENMKNCNEKLQQKNWDHKTGYTL